MYLTLPSNTINSSFNNTIANFKCKLQHSLYFEDAYEAALTELIVPFSWFNLTEDCPIVIYVKKKDKNGKLIPAASTKTNAYVPKGRYHKIEDLLRIINLQFQKFDLDTKPSILLTNSYSRYIKINFGSLNNLPAIPLFEPTLANLLGFSTNELLQEVYNQLDANENTSSNLLKGEKLSSGPYQLDSIYNIMYVYTDLVKASLIGNTQAQLLRTVAIPHDSIYGKHFKIEFHERQYFELVTNNVNEIEIVFRDHSGNLWPFEKSGTACCTLHLRRKA